MSNNYGVMVSVEVPAENLVHEITYDGQELLQTPLSMTESLTRLAHRIDFSGTGIPDAAESEAEKTDEQEDGTFKTLATWPWDQMRNKLRNALTELCVLSDILQLSQQKKYLVLDPVQADHPDPRAGVTLIYKKKALAAASTVLLQGAERLRMALNDSKSKTSSLQDFHMELLRLRQNWRLRKVGNTILGDLSYKTAGSRFPQAGLFELQKAEDDPSTQSDLLDDLQNGSQPKPTSALRVIIPHELQGNSYIHVVIQQNQDTLSMANIGPLGAYIHPHEAQWQPRLEAAQNVLFCRELFSLMARDAVQLNDLPMPPSVVGNQITATLFPNVLLVIGLCHENTGKGTSTTSPTAIAHHNAVLEHSLHQLLRDVHRRNNCLPMPHPATAPVGVSKKRRLAGPLACDKQTLVNMNKRETILEEIIRQAQHVVLRLRTMILLDSLAKDIRDPLIITQWASLNAVTHSCVRINLLSSGYDATIRTPLLIHVKEKSLKCILKDGKAIHLSYEPQELRDVILSQIAVHQIMVLQSLAKLVGWFVSASSCHLGVGECELLGNATGALLTSPNGKRVIGVRVSPQNPITGIQVFVKSATVPAETETSMEDLSTYRALDMDKLEGKNFLNKMEILMAVLTDAT